MRHSHIGHLQATHFHLTPSMSSKFNPIPFSLLRRKLFTLNEIFKCKFVVTPFFAKARPDDNGNHLVKFLSFSPRLALYHFPSSNKEDRPQKWMSSAPIVCKNIYNYTMLKTESPKVHRWLAHFAIRFRFASVFRSFRRRSTYGMHIICSSTVACPKVCSVYNM